MKLQNNNPANMKLIFEKTTLSYNATRLYSLELFFLYLQASWDLHKIFIINHYAGLRFVHMRPAWCHNKFLCKLEGEWDHLLTSQHSRGSYHILYNCSRDNTLFVQAPQCSQCPDGYTECDNGLCAEEIEHFYEIDGLALVCDALPGIVFVTIWITYIYLIDKNIKKFFNNLSFYWTHKSRLVNGFQDWKVHHSLCSCFLPRNCFHT